MTFGQKLKKLRTENGKTQKELAEELHVTFQTVSKWENDENEPDFSTLKELTRILDCSIEYLFSEEDEPARKDPEPEPKPDIDPEPRPDPPVAIEPVKVKVGDCASCGKALTSEDPCHKVSFLDSEGREQRLLLCGSCYIEYRQRTHVLDSRKTDGEKPAEAKKGEGEATKQKPEGRLSKARSKNDMVPLVWGIILGAVALIIALIVCIANFETVGLAMTIVLPILLGYGILSTIYCIFTFSYISDVFVTVASWSIHLPGLIFTWDLEGIIWLIAMKITLAVIGFLFGVFVFLLALSVSMVLSLFSFIPLLIYNRAHPQV